VSSKLLLDTSVLVRLCHPSTAHADVQEWLRSLLLRGKDAPELLVSVISDYEIRQTFLRRGASESLSRLDDLARSVTYVPLSAAVARRAAELAASLSTPWLGGVADADFLIAAQAMALSAVLVTSDRRLKETLKDIADLPVKDWHEVVLD